MSIVYTCTNIVWIIHECYAIFYSGQCAFIYLFFISSAWFSFSSTRINNSSAGLCVQRVICLHLIYRLHAWWHIRLWRTASICFSLWLLPLPLPNCSSLACLWMSPSSFSKLVFDCLALCFLQVATPMLLYTFCCCPYVRHGIAIFFCIITSLAFFVCPRLSFNSRKQI